MSEPTTEQIRRCPADQRPLERVERWLCPRCLREHADSPVLLGRPRAGVAGTVVGGRPINLKLGERRVAAVQSYADAHGISRAAAVRALLDVALAVTS